MKAPPVNGRGFFSFQHNLTNTDFGTKEFGVKTKISQCACHTFKYQTVSPSLILVDHVSELTGDCKGDHKIMHRQNFILLPVDPVTGLMVLALGTTTVSAWRDKKTS